jgi:protein phosphatase 1 regulatory subunit 7
VTDSRITNFSKINKTLLDKELKSGREITLQFSYKKYDNTLLSEINELCSQYNDNLSIRFYDHGKTGFDCNTILKIPNVKNLCLDCLNSAKNIKAVSELENLVSLNIGILKLEDYEILRLENLQGLQKLGITETISTKVNLEYLAHYAKLKELYIDGHTKNIHSIGSLQKLETLYLRAIKKTPLNFINEMQGLETLHILLGGRHNLNEIETSNIKNLTIDWVLGFNDISGILKLKKLEKLKLSLLKQLKTIKIQSTNTSLKDLCIFGCKDLNIIEGLDKLKVLIELGIIEVSMKFEEFLKLPLPKTLKVLDFCTFKERQDKEIRAAIESLGYKTIDEFGNRE